MSVGFRVPQVLHTRFASVTACHSCTHFLFLDKPRKETAQYTPSIAPGAFAPLDLRPFGKLYLPDNICVGICG